MRTKREQAVGNVIQGPWSTPAPTGADESEPQRLAQEIAAQIVAGQGSVVRWTAELPDVDDWRRAARRAGRLLGVRIRTGVSDDGTKVWVVDESYRLRYRSLTTTPVRRPSGGRAGRGRRLRTTHVSLLPSITRRAGSGLARANECSSIALTSGCGGTLCPPL